MSNKLGNEQAYPLTFSDGSANTGLTKREYFAAQLMAGMLACPHQPERIKDMAEGAVKNADALCEALENNDD